MTISTNCAFKVTIALPGERTCKYESATVICAARSAEGACELARQFFAAKHMHIEVLRVEFTGNVLFDPNAGGDWSDVSDVSDRLYAAASSAQNYNGSR